MASSKKRLIEAEDLYRFELISTPRISPDGTNVVCAQHRVDQKPQKKYANLWVAPVSQGNPHQFTFGDQTDVQPRHSLAACATETHRPSAVEAHSDHGCRLSDNPWSQRSQGGKAHR